MDYITTTNLRTQTPKLLKALQNGKSVDLVHRSQIVGVIAPKKEGKPFDVVGFKKLVKELNLPHTSDQERERRYRKHLMKKYGKGLS